MQVECVDGNMLIVGKGRGGHCEHAAGALRRLTGTLPGQGGHCMSAAWAEKYVWGISEVKGASVGKLVGSGWGRCNNAAEGRGRAEVASGKGVGHWRTPVREVGREMQVWGGKVASIVLAGGLEFLALLAVGRLERAWEVGFGRARLLGAGVGARGCVGGFLGP